MSLAWISVAALVLAVTLSCTTTINVGVLSLRITYLRPPSGPGVRWDDGFEAGDEVTLHYDSMIAKLIVWGVDRPAAIERARRALAELVVVGIATNQGFHSRLLADDAFRRGEIDIQFLDRRPDLLQAGPQVGDDLPLVVLAARLEADRRSGGSSVPAASAAPVSGDGSAWPEWDGARRTGEAGRQDRADRGGWGRRRADGRRTCGLRAADRPGG